MPASYRVRVHMTKGTVALECDFYFATSSADGSYTEAGEIVDGFIGSSILGDFLACIPDDVVVEAISAASVVADGGSATGSATWTEFPGNAGTRAPGTGGQTSNQSGPIITYFPEPAPGERVRTNKIFVPTINEVDAEDDVIVVGLRTALASLAASLTVGFAVGAGAAAWVALINLVIPGTPPVKVPTVRAILGWVAETWVASQRRRRPAHF